MTSVSKNFWVFGYTLLLSLLLALIVEEAPAKKILNDTFVTRPFRHHIWQEVLSESVDSEGNVDFEALRVSPKRLNHYLAQLAQVSPMNRPDLFPTSKDQLAYWLNAHNALALRLILDAYPVEDLKTIPDFSQNHRYALGGLPYSVTEIEQLVGRRFSHWPQAAFALSTLTVQDPPLLNEAYRSEMLEQQLKTHAQQLMQDPRFVEVREGSCVGLALSSYFETQTRIEPSNLLSFIKPYLSPDIRGQLAFPCEHSVTFLSADTRIRQLSRP